MFKKNSNNGQISILDPYLNFPQSVKEALHKSWADHFYKHIFRNINEDRFSVLYSTKCSRPNTPVNILVGLLFLKELNHWIDEELVASLYFDYRIQFALGITDFDKERICVNTLGNFRGRLYEYAEEHGVDILQEEVDALSQELIRVSEMDTSMARQDSLMISANCKKMGRLEIVYTVNSNVAKSLSRFDEALVPESCNHYLKEKDRSSQIYRLRKEDVPDKLTALLNESLDLYEAVPENLHEDQDFLNLVRLLEEQTGKAITSTSMQNPSEPDATYRTKAGQKFIGYVLNAVEVRDQEKKMSIIVHHEQQANTISDVQLGKNALDAELPGVQTIVSDGAFFSGDNIEKAKDRDIELVFSALTGRKMPEGLFGVDKFNIDPETRKITSCPNGMKPFYSDYDPEKKQYMARFDKADCSSCPLLSHCPTQKQTQRNVLNFKESKLQVDICRSQIGAERHEELADFRAGVEGIPSVLRRAYNLDRIPVRGLVRSRLWVHCKVMAFNFKSFFRYLRSTGNIDMNIV